MLTHVDVSVIFIKRLLQSRLKEKPPLRAKEALTRLRWGELPADGQLDREGGGGEREQVERENRPRSCKYIKYNKLLT